jgi:FtsH-binding integral membrane protein
MEREFSINGFFLVGLVALFAAGLVLKILGSQALAVWLMAPMILVSVGLLVMMFYDIIFSGY